MSIEIELAYGRDGITLKLPDEVSPTVIRKQKQIVSGGQSQLVTSALASPMGCEELGKIAKDC